MTGKYDPSRTTTAFMQGPNDPPFKPCSKCGAEINANWTIRALQARLAGDHNPDGFYASLVGPFLGYYCEVPGAHDEEDARYMLNQDRRMKSLWMSIYSLERVNEGIKKYGGQIIKIRELDAHHWCDREHYK